MRPTWKIGICMMLGMLLLAACGNSQQAAERSGDRTRTPAAQSPGGNEAASAPSAADKESGSEAKQRTVSGTKGDIVVPAKPERVVGLSVVYPDFLYALGTIPAAVQNYHDEFPAYLKEPLQRTLKMGVARTPNFEAILSVEPDLIVAPDWWAAKDYEALSQIAPTVLLPQRDNWRDELRDIAAVLGKPEAAEQVIRQHEDKTAAVKKRLDALVGDQTVLYMRIMPKEIILHGENIARGDFVHRQLGLKPLPTWPQSEASKSISLEVLPDFDADHILVQIDDEANDEVVSRYNRMLDSALWKNMKAVRNRQVYVVGGKEWFNLGMSPLADQYAMDDIVAKFEAGQQAKSGTGGK